ncbi:MAG: sulfurtransferase [Bacteroidetes bacterium GWF2_38_335]|nr:MAG: sulfurtransferase [Bacteroidetes bacterium GWF2_38_335]OFY77213.1 MAG: sulfurtransferase [Bacteroidetes bacterium RIFOXYA12_FULL_38_20]HBS85785.1 sulfurtransferase [Bacteroidales bacterium]
MGPIIPIAGISTEMGFLIAFAIGLGFGFVLEQAGFSSSRRLAGMFYGYDTTVLKVFFTAAIVAMINIFFLNYFEMIDLSMVYIHDAAVYAALIGGVIMGVGFITGGYCPGTSVCAAAIGKVDAIFFIFGILLGVFVFGFFYPVFAPIMNPEEGSMWFVDNELKVSDALGLSDGIFALVLICMAIVMFWGGEWLEKKFARPDITKEI